MVNKNYIRNMTIKKLIDKYPYVESFFEEQGLNINNKENLKIDEIYDEFSIDEREDMVVSAEEFITRLKSYIDNMQEFLGEKEDKVRSIALLAGTDKDGHKEKYDKIKIDSGEVISIVGPTGSGKSRLLADIEWAARGDTPTGRQILINGEVPDRKWRLSGNKRLVAQLSQNMNFVMDLPVKEFLHLHAESRLIENEDEVVERIIIQANELAGESFTGDDQITSLSGGQSRALMIADTAILSSSPIVLIDEIENAGIDREKALDLLVGEEKVVLMATHDPILALMGDRRIVINNGGIVDVIKTTKEEINLLEELKIVDEKMYNLRERLRYGDKLPSFILESLHTSTEMTG